MWWNLLFALLSLIPTIAIAVAYVALKWLRKDSRRDPLTSELHALPGARIQQKLNKLEEDGLAGYMSGVVICGAIAALVLRRHVTVDISALNTFDFVLIVLTFCVGAWTCITLVRSAKARRKHYQGLRAEIATAQEITIALASNHRLLNDLDCKEFNIDHVVVAAAGIFAIETKSRRKPAQGSGSPKVLYDGKSLRFPDWSETKPIAQAARQAQWLKNYCSRRPGIVIPSRRY